MKHHQLLFVIGLALSVAACGPSKSGSSPKKQKPEEVTNLFLKSFMELDFETCKTTCTAETAVMVDGLASMTAMLGEEELKKAKEDAKKTTLDPKKTTCKIVDDNNANCTTCCDENGAVSDKPITLKKVDGAWKVHLTKEDLGGESEGQ